MEQNIIYQLFQILLYLIGLLVGIKILKFVSNHVYELWFYSHMPGLKIVPFIGNVFELWASKSKLQQLSFRMYRNFGNEDLHRLWIGTHPIVLIHNPELIEYIINDVQLNDKSNNYDLLECWLKSGLLISDGKKWYDSRKLINPSFHMDVLKQYLNIINENAAIFIESISKLDKTELIELEPFLKLCALDIICETAMGQSVNAQTNSGSEYVKAISEMCENLIARMNYPWLWPDFIYKFSKYYQKERRCLSVLHGFTRKIMNERAQSFHGQCDTNTKRIAFLDMLLDARLKNPELLSLDDIQQEVDTFMFAGHDTVSTALHFACYNIATHPEVQSKIYAELNSVFGSSNRNLTLNDLNQLSYLECAINESLRLHPSVPIIGRNANDNVKIGKYAIRKNCSIYIDVINIHRDPKNYSDPESYKPERFLNEDSANRRPYSFLPFSHGRRNCIGKKFAMMELKTMLTYLLRNYIIECNQKEDEIKFYFEIVLRHEVPILFKLKQRIQ